MTQHGSDERVDQLLATMADDLDEGMVPAEVFNDESVYQRELRQVFGATGSRARPSPWEGSSGVHLMRTRGDAARLAADLEDGGRLLVVGAGFVGAEVAASARGLGLEVTLVDPQPAPLSRVLGEDVGSVFAALHSGHGVDTRFGVGVDTLTGGPGAWTAELTDGSSVLASTVLVCVGGQPNDEWLRSSGLEVEDGLCCDRFCRATRDDRVFAVGDVARWWHPRHGESVRIEHWTNAVEQAAVVAHNIVHAEDLRAHAPVEYVWSDQYDWKIQLVGRTQGTEPVMLGSPEDGRFAVAYPTAENLLVGLLAVNWPKAMLTGRRGIGQGMGLAELVDRLGLASGRTA